MWAKSRNIFFQVGLDKPLNNLLSKGTSAPVLLSKGTSAPVAPILKGHEAMPASWLRSLTSQTNSRCGTSQQSAQLWNSQSSDCQTTSPNQEIPAMLVRPSVQNAPEKVGDTCPAGYSHRKTANRLLKHQVEWLHPRPCLIPSWCWASKTIWDCY